MVEKVARMRRRLSEASNTLSRPSNSAMIGLRSSTYGAAAAAAASVLAAGSAADVATAEAKVLEASVAAETAAEATDDHEACDMEPVARSNRSCLIEWQ